MAEWFGVGLKAAEPLAPPIEPLYLIRCTTPEPVGAGPLRTKVTVLIPAPAVRPLPPVMMAAVAPAVEEYCRILETSIEVLPVAKFRPPRVRLPLPPKPAMR